LLGAVLALLLARKPHRPEEFPAGTEVTLVFGAGTPADAIPQPVPEAPASSPAPHAAAAVTSQPRPGRTPAAVAVSRAASAPAAIRPRHNRQTDYSETARRQQGRVILRVSLSAEGAILDVTVAQGSGVPALDAAALATARQWHFDPPIRNGQPVATVVEVPMLFRMPK
jgi:protein TonB